jgi:hypothetical protein
LKKSVTCLQLELAASLAEAANLEVFTQLQVMVKLAAVVILMILNYNDDDLKTKLILTIFQALNYIGNKIKPSKGFVLVCPDLFILFCDKSIIFVQLR